MPPFASRPLARAASLVLAAALPALAALAAPVAAWGQGRAPAARPQVIHDLILRGGTIVDGSGGRPFVADVAIDGRHVTRIGDLSGAQARSELDVRGLMVAPGFINIHSHAEAAALPTAENMLTQGVTTELLNADGSGPLDIEAQLASLERAGLAVNVAASAGFNTVWSSVVGSSNRRPTPDEITRMRAMVVANLERGAFGVSAGLDYKPAYFATAGEVAQVLEPARRWRTFLPNHDRLTPESGFSSVAGMRETMQVGEQAGLVPLFTHMKAQGHEQGSGPRIVEMMRRSAAEGRWVAGDVYPYLAGQTGLAALIIPAWAQDGGLPKMRERFADATLRARIVKEANEAIAARFSSAESIMLNETGRKLTDVMRERGLATAGDAVVSVMETEAPSAIMSFGAEPDLVAFLQAPSVAVACDCGATTSTRWHPRAFGTFPRVLGHYVRETRALSWEEAVRKMTGLPASITGMVDRGLLAPGMIADLAVFDSATVIDHATYERPTMLSEGIRHVLVNGTFALKDGKATGTRPGVALRRSPHMPSRPMRLGVARRTSGAGRTAPEEGEGAAQRLSFELTQGARGRTASGFVRLTGAGREVALESVALGTLQVGARWASVTGVARVRSSGAERAFTLIVEQRDPFAAGAPAAALLHVDGMPPVRAALTSVAIAPGTR